MLLWEQQRDVGQAENPSLSISLGAEADDLVAPGQIARTCDHRLINVLGCDQVKNDRHQAGVFNPLVSAREVVHRDSRPEHLTDAKMASRRVEAGVQLVNLVREPGW